MLGTLFFTAYLWQFIFPTYGLVCAQLLCLPIGNRFTNIYSSFRSDYMEIQYVSVNVK